MSDAIRQSFLREIIARPDDDAPRLVYADWLEEQGDAQAELIRAQIEQEHLPWTDDRWWELDDRARVLIKKLGPKLLKEQPKLKSISWSLLTNARSIEDERTIFRRGCIEVGRAKHMTALEDAHDALADGSLLREIRLFAGSHWPMGDRNRRAVERLCESPWMPRLRGLTVHQLDAADISTIANCPAAAGLEQLSVGEAQHSDGMSDLIHSPHLKNLRYLDLSYNRLRASDLSAFHDWEPFIRLRALSLGLNNLGTGLLWLIQHPMVSDLHLLDLRMCDVGDRVAEAIGASKYLQSLTHLSLRANSELSDAGVAGLVRYGGLPRLRVLSLSDCYSLGDASLEAIAAWPGASKLRGLYLGRLPNVSWTGIRALAASPHLCELRWLSVRQYVEQYDITPFRALTLNAKTARLLADSLALAKLTYLNVGEMQFTGDAEAILTKRFRKALVRKPFHW